MRLSRRAGTMCLQPWTRGLRPTPVLNVPSGEEEPVEEDGSGPCSGSTPVLKSSSSED